jgi:LysM repeat protein
MPPVNQRKHERNSAPWSLAVASGVTVALLAACAQPGPGDGPAAPPPQPQPTTAPAPPPPPLPAAVAAPESPVPYSPATAQRLTVAAIDMLEQGQQEQAAVELRRALQSDPNHRLAQNMLRQIEADPQAVLGRESFPYRVQPGETLSRIAQRFMGDVHQFYILARYNDIPVPRQLQGGQLLRIPGKAPPPGTVSAAPPPASPAAPAPKPVPVAVPAPPPATAAPLPAAAAPGPAPAPPPSPPEPPPEPPRATEAERTASITAATRAARAAFARQDLDTAIRQWDIVLDLDPQNAVAQLERRRAVELRERLNKVR